MNRTDRFVVKGPGGATPSRESKMKTTLLSLSLILTLAGTGAAFAQDQGPGSGSHHGEFRAACGADMQTFCASAQSHDDRHACMQANMSKLSDSCKSFIAAHQHGGGQ